MTMLPRSAEHGRFMAALYRTPHTRFASLPDFAVEVRDRIDAEVTTPGQLTDLLMDTARETQQWPVLATEDQARRYVEGRDLQRIAGTTVRADFAGLDCSADAIRAEIVDVCQQAAMILYYHDIGDGTAPAIFIDDELPAPYHQRGGLAVATSWVDESEYGIPRGIHFLRAGLTPTYSAFLALHEIGHTVLAGEGEHRIAHGLEEGLCDVLGIWLSVDIFGTSLTRTLYIHNRLSSQYQPQWERYLDTARQALSLIVTYGLVGVHQLVASGRQELYALEQALPADLPARTFTEDVDLEFVRLAWELLITYPRAFVCSPVTLLFAEHLDNGRSIAEVADRARLTLPLATHAAHQLADQFGAVQLGSDQQTILEGMAAVTLAQRWLRYN